MCPLSDAFNSLGTRILNSCNNFPVKVNFRNFKNVLIDQLPFVNTYARTFTAFDKSQIRWRKCYRISLSLCDPFCHRSIIHHEEFLSYFVDIPPIRKKLFASTSIMQTTSVFCISRTVQYGYFRRLSELAYRRVRIVYIHIFSFCHMRLWTNANIFLIKSNSLAVYEWNFKLLIFLY